MSKPTKDSLSHNKNSNKKITVKEIDHGQLPVLPLSSSDEDDQEVEIRGRVEESKDDEEERELEERLKELEDTDEWLKKGLPWFPDIADYPLPVEEDTATSSSTDTGSDEESEEDDPTSAVWWLKDFTKNKRTRRGGFYGKRNLK